MAVLTDVFNDVIDMAEAIGLYAPIDVGSMPADNGLSMAVAAGGPKATMLDKSTAYQLTLVLNGKHSGQQTAMSALADIHEALTKRKKYPNTQAYQITNISTIAAPSYIGRENNGQWLYGSSFRVDFYYR